MYEAVITLRAIEDAMQAGESRMAAVLIRAAVVAAEEELAKYDAHWLAREDERLARQDAALYADLPF